MNTPADYREIYDRLTGTRRQSTIAAILGVHPRTVMDRLKVLSALGMAAKNADNFWQQAAPFDAATILKYQSYGRIPA